MKKMIAVGLFLSTVMSWAQEPVKWVHQLTQVAPQTYDIQHIATIDSTWHLYSQFSNPEGAVPTEITYLGEGERFSLDGNTKESESKTAFDTVFEMDLTFFENQAIFTQRLKINDPALSRIEGEINYQACDDKLCIFRTEPFRFSLDGKKLVDAQAPSAASQVKAQALLLDLKDKALLGSTVGGDKNDYGRLFVLGLLGGLLALLTPCVFPMIPLTVSFFLKQQDQPGKGTGQALLYGFFIVLIYALLSLPFHLLDNLNPEFLNTISTNVGLNVVFFAVFVVFAFSFFGYFELTLPTAWGSRSDAASQWQGVIGVFFMALTLAIVSFSCTGPILGSLLAGSLGGSSGALQLTYGMLGFGVALAFPFAFFALFPKWLQALPQSGGWMTTVKVTLGFLELALALKFLSNADLVAHWGLLKRELFIGIWTLLAFGLTLYLFGIYRFPHEVKMPLSFGRKVVAFFALVGTSYLFLGLISSDNKLTLLSGFPPPEFYSLRQQDSDCPLGLDCYKDFETGRAVAAAANKPILLDFTGWACVNCRKMEENVWSDPQVYSLLKEKFILISLYVDDREPLVTAEQFSLPNPNGSLRKIDTVGEKWAAFQALNFQSASQPFYVLLTAEGRILGPSIQYTDTTSFQQWLTLGWTAFSD